MGVSRMKYWLLHIRCPEGANEDAFIICTSDDEVEFLHNIQNNPDECNGKLIGMHTKHMETIFDMLDYYPRDIITDHGYFDTFAELTSCIEMLKLLKIEGES